jgi:hypothetical protein
MIRPESWDKILRMTGARILVANDPLSYRQAISGAIQVLRPDLEVVVAEPEDLDGYMIPGLLPDLVICSSLTAAIEEMTPSWIELYPDGEQLAVASIAGELCRFADIGLSDLLGIIEKVENLRPKA